MNVRNRRPFSDVRGVNTPCEVVIVVSGMDARPARSRSAAAWPTGPRQTLCGTPSAVPNGPSMPPIMRFACWA